MKKRALQPGGPVCALRQKPPRAHAQIVQAGAEALGVLRAALEAAHLAAAAHEIQKINVVMVAHPVDLAAVAGQSFQLDFDGIGYVHIFRGREV